MKTPNSFWSLLTNGKSIEIPALQRDYAHGRSGASPEGQTATQVRRAFLSAIDGVLTERAPATLCLDFMFGPQSKDRFLPIDGQQRLTTLFLYHWYLIPKSEDPTPLSRFQYYTRDTSNAFCSLLSRTRRSAVEPVDGKLSAGITNLGSFFLRWRTDPTVQGMLNVLDDIHERWKNRSGKAHTRAWKRLTDCDAPTVYFYIPIDASQGRNEPSPDGATVDTGAADLYIRMNARGKPLTAFEQYKAWLEEHVEHPGDQRKRLEIATWEGAGRSGTAKSWKALLDSEWTDVFWEHDDGNQIVDEEFLRFFTTIAVCDFALENDFSDQPDGEGDTPSFRSIAPQRGNETYVPTHLFEKYRIFNDRNLKLAFEVLDAVAVDGEDRLRQAFYDLGRWPETLFSDGPSVLLEDIVSPEPVTYNDRVRFYAIARFVAPRHTSIRQHDKKIIREVAEFARIVDNLVGNLQTERETEFQTRIRQIDRLVGTIEKKLGATANSSPDSVYSAVAGLSSPDIKRISGEQDARVQEQLVEEVRKCTLMLKDSDAGSLGWEEAIVEAETKAFTRGRIAFLLDYVERSTEVAHRRKETLRRYASLMDALFHQNRTHYDSYENEYTPRPVKDFRSTFLLRRALLTKGYFGFSTGRNWSFCGNLGDAGAERRQWYNQGFSVSSDDEDELMYLVLQDLSERVGKRSISPKNVRSALASIVDAYLSDYKQPDDWRWWFIKYPKLFQYSDHNETSWIGNRGEPEALTYVLKLRQLNGRHVEMVSYCFFLEMLDACAPKDAETDSKDRASRFPPFRDFDYYAPSNTSESPCMYLDLLGADDDEADGPHYAMDISFDGSSHNALTGDMVLNFFVRDSDEQLPRKLEKTLRSTGFEVSTDENTRNLERRVRVTRNKWLSATKKAIEETCQALGQHVE